MGKGGKKEAQLPITKPIKRWHNPSGLGPWAHTFQARADKGNKGTRPTWFSGALAGGQWHCGGTSVRQDASPSATLA